MFLTVSIIPVCSLCSRDMNDHIRLMRNKIRQSLCDLSQHNSKLLTAGDVCQGGRLRKGRGLVIRGHIRNIP